jgi:hypothetical protein
MIMQNKELIYREDLIAEYDRVHQGPAGGARKLMVDVPAVDAVEVVRCKDCIQWKRNIGFTNRPNGYCFYHCIDTNGFDFCSFGEKERR